jgi:DNA-binding transcriptional ArsR family regulator
LTDFFHFFGISLPPLGAYWAGSFYIDSGQSVPYSYLMNSSEQPFHRMLQVVADPARRRILQALKKSRGNSLGKGKGLCASDIERQVSLSQPTISHHMAVLAKAGLVHATKLGQWVWYRRNERAITRLLRTLRQSL